MVMGTLRSLVRPVLAAQDSNVWETHNYWQHKEKGNSPLELSLQGLRRTYIELAAIPTGKERSGAILGWNNGGGVILDVMVV